MSPMIEKKTNSAPAAADISGKSPNRWATVSGWLITYETTPNPVATPSEKTIVTSIPSTEATWLTTAFDERSELRSKRHFNQISVSSCDIDQCLYENPW